MQEPLGPPLPPFRDRGRELAVYGWVLIAFGALCGLIALLLLAVLAVVPRSGVTPAVAPDPRAALFNTVFYLLAGAALVALGIGSIRARRWARTLTLILAWVWLATGVLALLVMGFLLPTLLAGSLAGPSASGMVTCVTLFSLLFVALFFVVLPLVLLLFYRREDVRQTIEARDPLPGWTDRVAPSILGIVLALGVGAAASILSVFGFRVVPIFSVVLTGWPATLVLLFFAAVSAGLAVAVYRRSSAGWWGLVLLQVLGLANPSRCAVST